MSERDDMARVIRLSCATRMNPETAMHYANNLIAAGFGRIVVPSRDSEEWKALVQAAEELGVAVAKFQNARDAFVTHYPKDKQ